MQQVFRSSSGGKFVQRNAGKSGRVTRIKPKKHRPARVDLATPAEPRPIDVIEAEWLAMREQLGVSIDDEPVAESTTETTSDEPVDLVEALLRAGSVDEFLRGT